MIVLGGNMLKIAHYLKLFIIIGVATSALQGAAAQQVHVNAQAQAAAPQLQNQPVVAQQGSGKEIAKTAIIVTGAVIIGLAAGSVWPVAFGVGYGVREVSGWFRRSPVVAAPVQQVQAQQAQAQANAQVVNNIIQGPDHQDMQRVVISIKTMKKSLHNFRNESFRNMEHINHRFDRVDQGQAELLRGQHQLGEGQAEVLNRVNYVARLIEQRG